MFSNERLKEKLQQEIADLHQAREELLLQAQVEFTDVRAQWDRIDQALESARAEIGRLSDHSVEEAQEIVITSRRLVEEARARLNCLRVRDQRAVITSACACLHASES